MVCFLCLWMAIWIAFLFSSLYLITVECWSSCAVLQSHNLFWFVDGPTSLSNYLDCKQRGVTGAKRGAIKWAINRDVTFGEGELTMESLGIGCKLAILSGILWLFLFWCRNNNTQNSHSQKNTEWNTNDFNDNKAVVPIFHCSCSTAALGSPQTPFLYRPINTTQWHIFGFTENLSPCSGTSEGPELSWSRLISCTSVPLKNLTVWIAIPIPILFQTEDMCLVQAA